MPKNSKARLDANRRWNAKAYDQVTLYLSKGKKQQLADIASTKELTVNAYIKLAIENQLLADLDSSGSLDSSVTLEGPEDYKDIQDIQDIQCASKED